MYSLTCVHFIDTVEEVVWCARDAVAAHTQATICTFIPGVVGPAESFKIEKKRENFNYIYDVFLANINILIRLERKIIIPKMTLMANTIVHSKGFSPVLPGNIYTFRFQFIFQILSATCSQCHQLFSNWGNIWKRGNFKKRKRDKERVKKTFDKPILIRRGKICRQSMAVAGWMRPLWEQGSEGSREEGRLGWSVYWLDHVSMACFVPITEKL